MENSLDLYKICNAAINIISEWNRTETTIQMKNIRFATSHIKLDIHSFKKNNVVWSKKTSKLHDYVTISDWV